MPYPVWNANDGACTFMGDKGQGYGIADGTRWCPAHCDAVLRRHWWFWNNAGYNSSSNLNTAPILLGMHMTSVGRGCNMILDMSPTPAGLLEAEDSATYAAFGVGLRSLYEGSAVVGNVSGIPGQAVLEWTAAPGAAAVSRGALELREHLEEGQAITNYTVEYCPTSPCAGMYTPLPLHNEGQLTIGNRRRQFWVNTTVSAIRVTVSTLELQSGPAPPNLRSFVVFDWSSSTFDPLLTHILAIP
jgi:hypothetical protein